MQLGATKQQLQEAEKRDIFSRNSEGTLGSFSGFCVGVFAGKFKPALWRRVSGGLITAAGGRKKRHFF